MASKWVCEDDDISISASIEYHFEIVKDRKKVSGGGYWKMDRQNNIIWLYGSSDDFGQCTEEQVRSAVKNGIFGMRFEAYKILFSKCELFSNDGCVWTLIKDKDNDGSTDVSESNQLSSDK